MNVEECQTSDLPTADLVFVKRLVLRSRDNRKVTPQRSKCLSINMSTYLKCF